VSFFRLTINLDNAVFDGDRDGGLAAVLHRLASDIADDGAAVHGVILDGQGDTIGAYEVAS